MSITNRKAADLICIAFEGGSGYWAEIEGYQDPEKITNPWGNEYAPRYVSYPFSEGGVVIVRDMEDNKDLILDKAAIERGKKAFEDDKFIHHYMNAIKENDDAETGDVFLQLCLFGDVIYG